MPVCSRPMKLLLGVTGSVAAVKFADLIAKLRTFAEVKVVVTKTGQTMMALAEGYDKAAWDAVRALEPPVPVLTDADEWEPYHVVGKDTVLHIEVRAPTSACLSPLS